MGLLKKKARSVVGLDIEPGFMAAAEISNSGRPTLQRAATSALTPGLFHEGEVTNVDGLADQLRGFFRDNDLPKVVRLGIASQKVVVRVIELPDIEGTDELEAAVRFQAQEELPMPLEQAVLDHRVLEKFHDGESARMRVLMVAVRRETIDHLLAAARKAGLDPQIIDLSAFALVRALFVPSSAPVALTNGAGTEVNGGPGHGDSAGAVQHDFQPEPPVSEQSLQAAEPDVAPHDLPAVPLDPAEPVQHADPLDPVESIEPIEPIEPVQPTELSADADPSPHAEAEPGRPEVEQAGADPLAHFDPSPPPGPVVDISPAPDAPADATAAIKPRSPESGERAPDFAAPAADPPLDLAPDPGAVAQPAPDLTASGENPSQPLPPTMSIELGPKGGTAMLYCHVGGLTNLAIAAGTDCVFNRVLQNGIESMAETLAERKALTLEHARQWINHVALEKDIDSIEGEREIVAEARDIISRGVAKIADEVRLSLEYYQGSVPNAHPVERVVLAGQAIAMPGFPAALEREVGLTVEPRSLGAVDVKPGALDNVDGAQLTVAAGLAIDEVGA